MLDNVKLFEFDRNFDNQFIIGTDEAGRGPAAGGVFASAVFFNDLTDGLIKELALINDSKKLSKNQRENLYDLILQNTINHTVCVEVEEIEKINILNASLKAMNLACQNVIEQIKISNSEQVLVLVDGNRLIKSFSFPQKTIVKGDSKSASIAAASILAKVTRDRYMQNLSQEYPMYKWDKNAGYLTKQHFQAIDEFGTCKYHRLSFLRKHFEKSHV